jgi:predicted ABC-type transport system involved in lysophospholipase L1 biosynthesis ATPase subunit
MEMFMVRESLNRWMVENKHVLIQESEMAKAEATLAAKDMVDSIQDMLEKIGKMQNEQLPALLDTIRDQIGEQQAEAFKGTVTPLLQQLWQQLSTGREQADGAARALTGEATPDMNMGSEMGGDMNAAMPPEGGMEAPAPEGDGMGAVDAAAGGTAELGREPR